MDAKNTKIVRWLIWIPRYKFSESPGVQVANADDPVVGFIVAACVPRDASHASGTLERAEAVLAARPEIAASNIYAAAEFGDSVRAKAVTAFQRSGGALQYR